MSPRQKPESENSLDSMVSMAPLVPVKKKLEARSPYADGRDQDDPRFPYNFHLHDEDGQLLAPKLKLTLQEALIATRDDVDDTKSVASEVTVIHSPSPKKPEVTTSPTFESPQAVEGQTSLTSSINQEETALPEPPKPAKGLKKKPSMLTFTKSFSDLQPVRKLKRVASNLSPRLVSESFKTKVAQFSPTASEYPHFNQPIASESRFFAQPAPANPPAQHRRGPNSIYGLADFLNRETFGDKPILFMSRTVVKPFRLLDLPENLVKRVLEYVLVSQDGNVRPYRYYCPIKHGVGDSLYPLTVGPPAPEVAVMLANKHMNNLGRQILYEQNIFCFRYLSDMLLFHANLRRETRSMVQAVLVDVSPWILDEERGEEFFVTVPEHMATVTSWDCSTTALHDSATAQFILDLWSLRRKKSVTVFDLLAGGSRLLKARTSNGSVLTEERHDSFEPLTSTWSSSSTSSSHVSPTHMCAADTASPTRPVFAPTAIDTSFSTVPSTPDLGSPIFSSMPTTASGSFSSLQAASRIRTTSFSTDVNFEEDPKLFPNLKNITMHFGWCRCDKKSHAPAYSHLLPGMYDCISEGIVIGYAPEDAVQKHTRDWWQQKWMVYKNRMDRSNKKTAGPFTRQHEQQEDIGRRPHVKATMKASDADRSGQTDEQEDEEKVKEYTLRDLYNIMKKPWEDDVLSNTGGHNGASRGGERLILNDDSSSLYSQDIDEDTTDTGFGGRNSNSCSEPIAEEDEEEEDFSHPLSRSPPRGSEGSNLSTAANEAGFGLGIDLASTPKPKSKPKADLWLGAGTDNDRSSIMTASARTLRRTKEAKQTSQTVTDVAAMRRRLDGNRFERWDLGIEQSIYDPSRPRPVARRNTMDEIHEHIDRHIRSMSIDEEEEETWI